jgi:Zn-dependent peptidase ImmA (M78 family)/transcriptional regulator with XRE-family HTH domain
MEKIIIGERLKEVREARKLTQEELAQRIDITRASISAFEKGLKYPSVRTVEQLSWELKIPIAYLQNERPPRCNRITPLSYRKKSRTSQSIQNQMSRQEEWLEDIYSVYSYYIDFPEVNFIPAEPLDYEKLSDDDIEEKASELRTQWGMGLGPITNLTDFLEANGIVIGRAYLESDAEAVSVWRSKKPHILVNKMITACARIRMSLAHELGHLVLHRLVNDEDYEDEKKHEVMERQAAYFAGAFLFPRQSFFKEFHSIRFDALVMLKKRWIVSMGGIVMRAKNLGIINKNNVSSFYKQINLKGYSRTREPLDDTIPIEPIKLFSDAGQLLAENRINLQRIIDETLLSRDDFYTITDIEPVVNKEKNVKILQFRRDVN